MIVTCKKIPLKYLFIANLIIVVYSLRIVVYRSVYNASDIPKSSCMKGVCKNSRQTILNQSKSDAPVTTLFHSPTYTKKAHSKTGETENFNNESKSVSKLHDLNKKKKGFIYGDCYRYNNHGMHLLPSETLKRNHCQKRLPKAVVIGVKKCGTATIRLYLQLHTSITINGETQFPIKVEDVAKWKDQMLYSSPRTLPMTETSGYIITSVESKQRLKTFLDDNLKIIVIIRDPVTRAVSNYVHELHVVFRGRTPKNVSFPIRHQDYDLQKTFTDTVIDSSTGRVKEEQKLVRFGQYVIHLRGLMKVYSRDQLLILDGEAFVEDPLPSLRRVETFLGVPKFYQRDHFMKNLTTGFYCADVPERPFYHCANPEFKGRPHPSVSGETTEKLRTFYRPFNMQLAKEFDLDFPWLLK